MKRWLTREVMIGNIGVGGDHPVRIQSMTTSNTRDVTATAEQIMRLSDCGCEIARVTVQGMKEAEACEAIKNLLLQKGYTIPLVADIHFFPPAAMKAVEFVDKVRINPGNYLDKRATFKVLEYDDASYACEIARIEAKFTPLVLKCKELKKAMRIGTNLGSLSDRIMNRYGDTPSGMVESALEFAKVCVKNDFHDMIFSMKASNPILMVLAYRLLVKRMQELGWNYPLHLGVTEAGQGEDGRIKSAIGIGTLLLEGLGDTIRVSLTEDPWCEIDPCKRLIRLKREYVENHASKRKRAFIDEPKDQPKILEECQFSMPLQGAVRIESEKGWDLLLRLQPTSIYLTRFDLARPLFAFLKQHEMDLPIILDFTYEGSQEDIVILAAAQIGSLLIDGIGDGVVLDDNQLKLNILQGSRIRLFKTDFISCPSCGRTLFDLQEVSKRIRERTMHLPGVRIAIMGCIVNGPGEMADADFGYVGSKAGMIDLYVGKECVQKDIPHAEADDRLVALLKEHGKWMETRDQ